MPSKPDSGRPAHRHPKLEALALDGLPGLLAGVHLSALLFFLNPDLPFTSGPLLRASALFGSLLAVLSTALLAPFTWARPQRARRILPWAITVVLTLAAVLDGVHASQYSFYLPPGINVRLIKAALWLGLAALVFFYTALLHSLHRRRYGPRSRVGLTLLALATVYAVGERREAYRPLPSRAPLPSTVELEPRPNLLVVGLGGATLDAVLPLARQGQLPFFARLLEQGSYTHLTNLGPPSPAAEWTTVATGKLPFKHGVASQRVFPAELLAAGGPVRLPPAHLGFASWGGLLLDTAPVDTRHWRAVALWEILSRLGVPTGVLGWPATRPVPAGLAYAFSDRYFAGDSTADGASPAGLAERGVLFRVEPQEIDPELASALGDQVPFRLLEAVAEDLWRQSLAGFLAEQRAGVRARFVVLPGLEEVSRSYFGGYYYAQFEGTQKRRHLQAAQSLTAYYHHLDGFLERSWSRLTGRRLLVVVSVRGFTAPAGAHKLWRAITGRGVEGLETGPADGMLILAGDGIHAGRLLDPAAPVDVMPTLLYGMGFPIARDLDGEVLTGAFDSAFLARHPLTFVPSYETLAGTPLEPGPAAFNPLW